MKTLSDWRRAQSQAASMTARLVSQDARVVQTIPSLPARANLFNRIAHPSINGLGAMFDAYLSPYMSSPSLYDQQAAAARATLAAQSARMKASNNVSPATSQQYVSNLSAPLSADLIKHLHARIKFLSNMIDRNRSEISELSSKLKEFGNLNIDREKLMIAHSKKNAVFNSTGDLLKSSVVISCIGSIDSVIVMNQKINAAINSLNDLNSYLVREKLCLESDIARSNQLSSQNRT